MSFRGSECESRDLPKLQILSYGGSLSNVVDSSTPLRCGRNDITGNVSTDSPIVCAMFHAVPHFPHQSRPRGEPASPRGSFCTMLWVVPFNSTGCIRDVDGGRLTPLHRIRPTKYHFSIRLGYRDVAGGRLPPLHARWRVVPFNGTGSIRGVTGGW